MNQLVVICLCRQFSVTPLHTWLLQYPQATVYRDAVYCDWHNGALVVFDFGALVCWGLDEDERAGLIDQLAPFMEQPLATPIVETFRYGVGASIAMHNDELTLAGGHRLEMVACSFGLVQSVKLEQFELSAAQAIESTYAIPQRIAETGRSGLNRREISQLRGKLFTTVADINLKFDLLDTPEFFWEYPDLEDRYRLCAHYLDVQPRIEVLNKRLEVIHDLLTMLADEQNHKHSATLEWIIIWLIAFEVVVFLAHDIFKLF
ncbi:RMD1 family protein [Marinobacterium arenosum]|uniref:RMD1 family protein n=1 Tax=Marinobacterium arenosum TaxID=2862496 RepID=UPI001C973014|nr:RMD1 family protein [Marinobacterium arenosum]MBY4678507.1 RMD1 family protein [Marinobacterium arenosum]